jgi:uncharacterized repeat protein (TIGR03803 family)
MTFQRSLFVRGWLFALLLAAFFANCGFAAGQSEWVIHPFVATSTGRVPNGNLVADAAGNLYGTTRQGGAFDYGTVYELIRPVPPNTAWTETVLFSFGQNLEVNSIPLAV